MLMHILWRLFQGYCLIVFLSWLVMLVEYLTGSGARVPWPEGGHYLWLALLVVGAYSLVELVRFLFGRSITTGSQSHRQ